MYFSIIIPTYNPAQRIKKLLDSIVRNDCIDQIEVIISDDCSDESIEDILLEYKNINYIFITNDHHTGFPRTGRQNGLNKAKGSWICFADQDDYFVDNAFDKIKKIIEDNKIHNYLPGNFLQYDEESGNYIMYDGTKSWTHGKFYEKSFIDKYQIAYDDVRYCEDVNFSTHVGCVLVENNIGIQMYNDPVYVWCRHQDSLCGGDYFSKSVKDYIHSTFGIIEQYIAKTKNDPQKQDQFTNKFVQTLYHLYFYLQSDQLFLDKECLLTSMLTLLPIYKDFKKDANIESSQLIQITHTNLQKMFAETRNDDFVQVPFVEKMSFKDWVFYYLE